MSYTVYIRDTNTGETVASVQPFEWDKGDGYTDQFWWEEGNMACDCNRQIQFEIAKGNPPPQGHQCSHGRYCVPFVELPDGTRVGIDEPLAIEVVK